MKTTLKRGFLIFLMIGLCSGRLWAGGDYFMVSDVGSSARTIRKANIEGFSNLSSGIFENPASLYQTNQWSVSAFTTTLMNEVTYKNIALSAKLPIGTIGLGYMSAGVTDIPYTYENHFGIAPNDPSYDDSEFDVASYFEYNNTMAKLSYEISQTEHLHFGVSAVYYNTNLFTYKGQGVNFDAGFVIDGGPLALSVSAKNIIPSLKVKYNNGESENLPLQTTYGARYRWGDLDLLGQIRTVGSSRQILKSGGIAYRPFFANFFEISGGYREFEVINTTKNDFTLGIGLTIFDISLDYAYETSEHIEFNGKHYFSVGFGY